MILIVWIPMYSTNTWTIIIGSIVEVMVVAVFIISVDELTSERMDRVHCCGWKTCDRLVVGVGVDVAFL